MKETINEKIRNKVTPIFGTLSLLEEYATCENEKKKEQLLQEVLKILPISMNCVKQLCEIGIDRYEKEDEE